MKILTLLRHAKSDWADPAQPDFDRPLNARGREAALAMGREIAALGLTFDRILASPSARTTETIRWFGEGRGSGLDTDYDERIYLASVPTLLRIVHEVDDAHERLLIVGHNPGMERLALLLSRGGALHDLIAEKYPTGALAELRFDAESWGEVDEGGATVERFIRPRDLATAG
jgi:phosphohistidine phosphatase